MKIYSVDQMLPVSSSARQPSVYTIPPWYFRGQVPLGYAGEWTPDRMALITGGRVTSITGPAYEETGIALVKNNPFEHGVVIAYTTLKGYMYGRFDSALTLVNPAAGSCVVGRYDRLQVALLAFDTSTTPHGDITVQIYANELV